MDYLEKINLSPIELSIINDYTSLERTRTIAIGMGASKMNPICYSEIYYFLVLGLQTTPVEESFLDQYISAILDIDLEFIIDDQKRQEAELKKTKK